MQSFPEDLYEAAAVDGARRWRQFVHVTVPMLRPTIIFTVIISTIGGLQLFTEPYLFQPRVSGGTGGSARQYQRSCVYRSEKVPPRPQVNFRFAPADRGIAPVPIPRLGVTHQFVVPPRR